MIRAVPPLPTLPLWLATLIALGTEAAMVAGLAHWPERRVRLPAEAPIEVSLVSVPALADSAVAGAVGGPPESESPDLKPVMAAPTEPEPPEPKPATPEPPPPMPVRAPDPTPAPVALEPPKPKPKPKPPAKAKPPKPKSSPTPRTVPPKPARPANRSGAETANQMAKARAGSGTGSGAGTTSAKGTASTDDRSPAAYMNNPAPGYPDAARRQRQEGTVYLRVLVSASGRPNQVLVAGSSGVSSLDEAALRAVRRWRFKPARQNGRPISAWVRVPVRFKLNR
jgi:periplasmic protein TonB